jgi:hypothetical protein
MLAHKDLLDHKAHKVKLALLALLALRAFKVLPVLLDLKVKQDPLDRDYPLAALLDKSSLK